MLEEVPLQASAADQTDRLVVGQHQHAGSRAPVGGALGVHRAGENSHLSGLPQDLEGDEDVAQLPHAGSSVGRIRIRDQSGARPRYTEWLARIASRTIFDGVSVLDSQSWWTARVAPTCRSRRAIGSSAKCVSLSPTRIT